MTKAKAPQYGQRWALHQASARFHELELVARNHIRIEFDTLEDRAIEMLARVYVIGTALGTQEGTQSATRLLWDTCHGYLCQPGRHKHVVAFEERLIMLLAKGMAPALVAVAKEKARG